MADQKDDSVAVAVDPPEAAPAAPEAAPAQGPGATYYTPMHPGGVEDTSSDFEAGPMKFNPRVTLSSIAIIITFCVWCMVHTACDTATFDGTCSWGDDLTKEECHGLASGVTWVVKSDAMCTNAAHTSEDACNDACADCSDYFPADDGSDKACECPCPEWVEAVTAHCDATGSGSTSVNPITNGDLDDLVEDLTEAQCNELGSTHPPVWTDASDAGTELPIRFKSKDLTSADVSGLEQAACAAAGGAWNAVAYRSAGTNTTQAAIEASGTCQHFIRGCPSTSSGYSTEDSLDALDEYDQDWSAGSTFSAWKTFVASRFNWFYIGSQDVWIVFIFIVYFSKYSDIKLCAKGDEDKPPEFSDASWFSMLFCSGIGVGLFYFGVAEPVWHYTDGTNRYHANDALPDNQIAQDAMNLTFFHWGLHGFVVYTQVGLILGIVAHRWGLPMTMKSCFYPLLGDKIFGAMGDFIDTLSIITTLFGVCTSLGLGVMQLATGLERLTKDDVTGESGIRNTTGTQIAIVWVITALATMSVVSGLKYGIQRLSNIAFSMGLMILFVGLYIDDTWLYLNIFVQSVGYYIQYVIQLGSITSAWATTPFELLDAHGVDLSPAVSPSGAAHSMKVENKAWMDWWTLFYWGWWIAWSPFVGTFMAKISKGRTVKQFIMGSCFGPMLFGFIWFSVFGGAGIQMVRDAAANGITAPEVVAVLEKFEIPANSSNVAAQGAFVKTTGWVKDACTIQSNVHACADDVNCGYKYLKDPSLIVGIQGRSKEDMWYDMMLSYGNPDGFMGWLLYVFSMFSLVLYFVTSSDSGSLVIDILGANGVDEPPVVQRVFWACIEGLTATALLIAGGSNALNALSTVSIVAGLPYTVVLCFICTSIWRALQMDRGDMVYDKKTEFKMELAEIFTAPLEHLVPFLKNTLFPVLAIHSHGNLFYTIFAALLWPCFIAFHFFQIFAKGWWAMAWMAFTMLVLIIMDIRGKKRAAKKIPGNMVEDFFAALLFHGGVLTQIENEGAAEEEPATEKP